MRTSLSGILLLLIITATDIFAQVGFEQYCYLNQQEMLTLVPIFSYEARNHTYLEARYNYEELNTFSLYIGRTFMGDNEVAYSVTPMLGAVVGQFKGGSAAFNAAVEYKELFFSTQSQFTRSFDEENTDFAYAWSDLGYQPLEWFYVGVSAQQTYSPQSRSLLAESGILLGFTIDNWTFPLYYFNPTGDNQYFVVGVNYSVGSLKRNK